MPPKKGPSNRPRLTIYGKQLLAQLTTRQQSEPIFLVPEPAPGYDTNQTNCQDVMERAEFKPWVRKIYFNDAFHAVCEVVYSSSSTDKGPIPPGTVMTAEVMSDAPPKALRGTIPCNTSNSLGIFHPASTTVQNLGLRSFQASHLMYPMERLAYALDTTDLCSSSLFHYFLQSEPSIISC